jgi:glutaconate CoA-transferase subunit B
MIAMTKVCLVDEPVIEDFEYITDARATRWAEAYYPHDRLLSEMKLRMRCGVFFCGGMQVDRYGNSNLIGIKDDHGRLKVRGPGGIGTCNATAYNSRYHLVVMRHSNQILVEKCDFISALGYGDGSPKLRQRLGLPGAGPRYIITPLCVFEFDEIERSAVIRSLHPGVSIEEVVEKTGFDFEVPVNIPETELPTEEELFILRNRIDPKGSLRT